MLELIIVVLFIWLFVKAIGFSFKLAWGATKIIGLLLFVMALPVFFVCLLFAGGVILFIPLLMVGVACGVLKGR